METALRIENELIDELTGEILEVTPEDETKKTLTTEDLPKVCRALQAVQRRSDMIDKYLSDEISRLRGACSVKQESLDVQQKHLTELAEFLFRTSGEKKLEYPGIGSLKIGHTRESVDTTGYDELTPDEQLKVQEAKPLLFRTKTTIAPDKKVIKENIDDVGLLDMDREHPIFSIRPKVERFEFKAEIK